MAEKKSESDMGKEEKIGFHKGAINTLMAERNELLRIVNVTEELINAHISELGKLGVKLSAKEENPKK